ncbi:MAG: hypothetical protein JWO15_3689 [Sphingomonadales bacterium]|nr:hypothetical protein [Sphingomonadales bacterium]
MPALQSNVTAFLTQVKNDLTVGPSLDNNAGILFGAPRNFCSAQDIANVLRLLAAAAGNTSFLAKEITAIMNGKSDPSSQAYVGQIGGSEYLIVDAFFKLISYAGGTLPNGKSMFATTAKAGTSTTVIAVDTRGGKIRIDEFRGYVLSVAGVKAVIVSNTADGFITIDRPITAPSGGEAVLVQHAYDYFGNPARPKTGAGGGPGDNARLALLIQTAQDAVIAYTASAVTGSAMSGSAHVGGAAATFTVVFSGPTPTGNITVPVVSTIPGHATVSPASLTFTAGNFTTPQTVTVTGVAVDAGVPITVGPSVSTDPHYNGLSTSVTAVVVSP